MHAAVRATDAAGGGWSALSTAANHPAASALPQDLSLAGTLEAGRDGDVDSFSIVNGVGNSVGDAATNASTLVAVAAGGQVAVGGEGFGGRGRSLGELNLRTHSGPSGAARQTEETHAAAQSRTPSPPETSQLGDGSGDLDSAPLAGRAPKRVTAPDNTPDFPGKDGPGLPSPMPAISVLPRVSAPQNTPITLVNAPHLLVPKSMPAPDCLAAASDADGAASDGGGAAASEGGEAEDIGGDLLALYEELTEDAKSFAAMLLRPGGQPAMPGTAAGGEQADAEATGAKVGAVRSTGELASGAAGALSEDLVERWIREQMLREGRTPEDIEKERAMVKEGREGERKEEGLERGGGLAGGGSDVTPGRERDGKDDDEGGVTPVRVSRGDAGRDEQAEDQGGLWWGARLWEEEAADDEWCNARGIVDALSQLLRSNVCLYGQHFAARAIPVLAARATCKPEMAGNAQLFGAAAGELLHIAARSAT